MSDILARSKLACRVLPELPILVAVVRVRIEAEKNNKNIRPTDGYTEAIARLADKHGIPETTIKAAIRVRRTDEALFARCERGEITVGAAVREITAKHKHEPLRLRVHEMQGLAAQGYSSEQIAAQVGASAERVRFIARKHGLAIQADTVLKGTHRRTEPKRIVENTVDGLAGYAIGLQLLNGGALGIDRDTAHKMVTSLTHSLGAIAGLRRTLRRIAYGN